MASSALPDVLDWIELWRAGRQQDDGEVLRELQLVSLVPSGAVHDRGGTGGLDALPHNGAVITLLAICGLTHRAAYLDIAVVAAAVPIIALIVLITLGTLLGSF